MVNWYQYIEEQETDIPNEYIIKKHTLPRLSYELICDILYKFGGLQNPIVKYMKELKSKAEYAQEHAKDLYEKGEVGKREMRWKTFEVFREDELPLRNIKRFDDYWHDGYCEKVKLTAKSRDFLCNIYLNISRELNDGYYYNCRSFKFSNRKEEEDSVRICQ